MLQRTLLFAIILLFLHHRASPYKSLADFKAEMSKAENEKMTRTDILVGKAMDFVYSNKTIMNLLARELWNVGSMAIDKIVAHTSSKDSKNKGHTS